MDFSEQDKAVLIQAVELLWRKGIHNPQEAQIANALTKIAEKLMNPPVAVPPQKPELIK